MSQSTTTYLKDYKAPEFDVESIDLRFDLHDEHTLVKNKITMRPRNLEQVPSEIHLDGNTMELISVKLNKNSLSSSDYTLTDQALTSACHGSRKYHQDQHHNADNSSSYKPLSISPAIDLDSPFKVLLRTTCAA